MNELPLGWKALFAGRNGVLSIALSGGVALHAMNVYVATTILPSVVADIGGLEFYAWSTTIFVVASIIGSVLTVKLLQGLGPRFAYGAAATVFGLGTAVCAVAPSMQVLLFGRLVQGVGGGFLFALSYSMIRLVFDEALWPRAMALVSGMWGVATLLGPALGGLLAEYGAWRMAFWAVVPLAALFALIATRALPKRTSDRQKGPAIPLVQLILLALAVMSVSIGSARSNALWNIAGVMAAGLFIFLLVQQEQRSQTRLLPSGSLSLRSPLGLLFATMSLLAVSVTAIEMFVPLFLQVLHAQSPLVAGYLAAVMAGGWTVGSIASSGVQPSMASKAIVASPAITLLAVIVLIFLVPMPSDGSWITLMPMIAALVTVGLGVGLGWPHLLTRVIMNAPADEKDEASASITTVQLFATALGAAIAGMIVNLAGLTVPGGVTGTSDAAFWLFAAFAFAPMIAIWTGSKSSLLQPERRRSGQTEALVDGAH